MWLIGNQGKLKSKALIVVIKDPKRHQCWLIACFGAKSHYDQAGSCPHVADLMKSLKSDWYRQRTHYLAFGRNEAETKGMRAAQARGEWP